MKQYTKMKYSGIEWIGDIPEDWNSFRIKLLLESHKQGFYTEDEYVENGIKLLRITDIDNHGNIRYDKCPRVIINKKDHDIFSIEKNDFLFARSGTIGRFGLAKNPPDSVFASYLIRFRFKKIVPDFLKYLFLSNYFQEKLLSSLHGGANKNIHAENIKEIVIPSPQLIEEQKQIINFLDSKTSKIDSEIEKNKKLVTLLQEKRQATINHAVTKGLDDSVPMKYSGVKEIGDIPEHWEIRPIKYILKNGGDGITIGPFGTSIARLDFSKKSEFRLFGQNHAINADFIANPQYVSEQKFLELKKYEIFPNDVIVSRMGTIGKAVVVPNNTPPGIIHSHLIRIRIDSKNITQKFFKFLINSVYYVHYYLDSNSTGAIMKGLNVSIIKSTKICLPPKKELDKIGDFLEKQTNQFDELISKAKLQIKTLQEYRQSLISSAVTGKIDVREVIA